MFVETKKDGEAQVRLEPWRIQLLEAAHVIERRGWHRFGYCNNDSGAVCLMGALFVAAGYPVPKTSYGIVPIPVIDLERKVSCALYGHSFERVACWNDSPGRTKEEVIAVLRKAAAE